MIYLIVDNIELNIQTIILGIFRSTLCLNYARCEVLMRQHRYRGT